MKHLASSICLLIFITLPLTATAQVVTIPDPVPPPRSVRDTFELDPFYQQWIDVDGFPVLGSTKVNPYALKEAAWLIRQMIGNRRDLINAFVQKKVHFVIMAHNEVLSDIPEFSPNHVDFLVYNIRGEGGTVVVGHPTPTTGEENVLTARTYNILIHELGHVVHRFGLTVVDPTFDDRLQRAYDTAMANGLWQGTYAASNSWEYWAEGTHAWFYPQGGGSFTGNTRQALKKYDPPLASLLTEIYGNSNWRYTPFRERTHLPHLQGFNPQDAPTFQPSQELVETYEKFLNPNSDGEGKWMDLRPYDPSFLHSQNDPRVTGSHTMIAFINLTEADILLYPVWGDGTARFWKRLPSHQLQWTPTRPGAIYLIKDSNGKNLALFQAVKKTGRALITPTLNLITPGLSKVSGDNQSGISGAVLSNPFVIEVRDQNFTVLEGISVTFTVVAGDGTLSVTHATTDANGQAESRFTLGASLGTHTVSVAAAGVGQSVVFNATAEAAVAIPDPHLRAVIENNLGKVAGAPITTADMATLTRLAKRNANISNLTGLESATNLTTLDLDENNITDISPVVGLTNLTWLLLGGNNISDISGLAGLTNLTELSLYNNNISDISAVTELSNLRSLWLSGNNVSDISAVAGLTNLTELGLGENNIIDISLVAGLTKLTYLRLGGNNITDISPLVGLTNLTWLQLWKNNITDIVSLVNNVGLGAGDEVELNNNPLSELSIQNHIPALQERGVTVEFDRAATGEGVNIPDQNLRTAIENQLGKPSGAPITTAEMEGLRALADSESNISDLTGLEHATNLFVLLLWGNNITDLSPLAGLTKLTALGLPDNNITDISPLAGLTNLTMLYLQHNNITDISPLVGLTNLTTLWIFNNNITDLSPLVTNRGLGDEDEVYVDETVYELNINTHIPTLQSRGVTVFQTVDIPDANLRAAIGEVLGKALLDPITTADMAELTELYANDSNISDLTGLEHATSLTELILQNNSISDISLLADLTDLTRLHLSNNNITDPSPVAGLTKLTALGLSNNNITDLSPLARLTELGILFLSDNNISDLSPLVENTGLGNGDEVNVEQNLLNYVSLNTVIPALQDKKVQIRFTRRTPGDVLIISGIDQQGEPGVTLDRPFVVEVRDETGVPFEGVPVAFTVTAGGGTVQPETVHTGSDGLAETTLTLGSTPGANTVFATVDGITEPVTFNAVGEVPDLVVDLPSVSKSTVAPGEKFTLSVTVRNQENRRADGTTLRYYRSTDATISSSDTEVGTASVSGLDANEDSDYSISLTAPTAAGVYYYGACVDTVDNETITANNCADGVEITVERVPTELVKLSGDNQSGVISQVLSSPFVVEVRDQDQTPLEAVPVMFAVIAGGGMLSATHTNTDASGLAETTLTLGSTPGTNTVLATVDGIAEPVTFNAVGEGIEFDLSMSAGLNLIHVPLKVTAIDDVEQTIESVGDLYDALGGADAVNFLITYDTSTQGWLSYFGNTDRGTANDKALTDAMGILAGMKAPTSVRLTGKPLGNNGTSTISLNQGLNLVGLPLRDSRINRVSDLLSLEGIRGNVPVIIVTVNGGFKSVGRAGDPGDVPITGGQGFLLTAQRAATVTLSGEGWSNDSVTAAAPKMLTGIKVGNVTPVLALKGSIVDEVTGVNRAGFRVAVKNLSTGRTVATTAADAEAGYRLAVVDIETMRAARVGDVLEISAQSTNPFIGVEPLRYTVTAEDVLHGWIQLPALVAYEIPQETELLANYPNPFNPETWIPYRLAEDADVKLTIYGSNGRVVRSLDVGHRVAAVYENRSKAIYWDGRNEHGEQVSSGVYFYHLLAGSYSQTRKMLILK